MAGNIWEEEVRMRVGMFPPRRTPGEQQPVLEAAWNSGKWNTTNLSKCDLPDIILNIMNCLVKEKF